MGSVREILSPVPQTQKTLQLDRQHCFEASSSKVEIIMQRTRTIGFTLQCFAAILLAQFHHRMTIPLTDDKNLIPSSQAIADVASILLSELGLSSRLLLSDRRRGFR